MKRWEGRVAVVTGASAGIGAGIAEELVKKGLQVVGVARRVEKVEELSRKLKSSSGKLHPLKCDVSNEADVKSAFKWITSNLGGVDILINNAGVASLNTLMNGPTAHWKKIYDLNVIGLSICTKEGIQSMKEKGVDGHIIHINSSLGHITSVTDFHMYASSKHAVTALTEGLRRELVNSKSKIRLTSLSPGVVRTELGEASGMPKEAIEAFMKDMPMLDPHDIADAVIYILGTPPHVQIHEMIVQPVGETA